MPNKRDLNDIDKGVQQRIAGEMSKLAATSKPEFIITVGDHFYPGGIDSHCGVEEMPKYQWDNMFEAIYSNDTLGMEWWGVLGNHDYGGTCYIKGWDQQIFYTWEKGENSRWLMPAQYWKRLVHFKGFVAEFFFLDNNVVDAKMPMDDEEHNICSNKHNLNEEESYCPYSRFPGPNGTNYSSCVNDDLFASPLNCFHGFVDLWKEQEKWFRKELENSKADWQIVVTHYPPDFIAEVAGQDRTLWPNLGDEYGIDLMIAGHTHWQKIFAGGPLGAAKGMENFPYVVSGGGGGITSEGPPDVEGNDDEYGFMDFTISKEKIDIIAFSHMGVARNSTTIYPRAKRSGGGGGPKPKPSPAPTPVGEGSCKDKCNAVYDAAASCQCNADCAQFESCCADFEESCNQALSA